MTPRPRPFYPEATQEPIPEITTDMEQHPENTTTPEQDYIDRQIRMQNPSTLTNRIKLPDAAKFDGKVSEYSSFISSMELLFWGSPETFTLGRNKVLFIGTHLLGSASTWFGYLIASSSPCLENYELFLHEFKNNFSDPSHSIKARGLIRSCKQGSRTASAYATEFRALARESGFDNVALVDQFLRGLSPKIMQYLMVADLPDTLEENIILAVRVDNRLCTVNLINENKGYAHNHNPFRQSNTANFNQNTPQNPPQQDATVYMDIDAITSRPRGPLSEQEKTRRYDLGLCLYCGGSGHIATQCPRKRSSGKARTQQ
ncbi:Retrotransposon-derived protein PEG10 [Smittium culicis]|uniref:Retrotransposon-derived protein PEG10 n=1 Tax=Smittium culicis TaxID=133412 RepID=A0A1R1YGT2_9FUNG|nr:Retrotransposon-derived protein PEG10 [Smittium culicis]